MRFWKRASVAAGWLAAAWWCGMCGEARAADATDAAAKRNALATQIYSTAARIETLRIAGSPIDARISAEVNRLRTDVDAMKRQAPAGSLDLRKANALNVLVMDLDHATNAVAASTLSWPARLPATQRYEAGTFGDRRNATCATALGFGSDREIDGTLAADSAIWLRFDAPGHAIYRITTSATPLDTDIAVFAACPASAAAQPLAESDDAFGLASAVAIDLRTTPGPRFVRVRNFGAAGPIAIIAGSTGTITGHMSDVHSGAPLVDVTVEAFDGNLSFGGSSSTDANGDYALPVLPNSYYVVAYPQFQGYVGEIWPDVECAFPYAIFYCSLEDATLVDVSAGATTPDIDFALTQGGRITGRVIDHVTGLAVTSGLVQIYDEDGNSVYQNYVDQAGRYQATGIAPGTYFAFFTSQQYVSQVFDDIDCPDICTVVTGTPIVVEDLGTSYADFDVTPFAYLDVTVRLVDGSQTFYPPIVEFRDASGSLVATMSAYIGEMTPLGPIAPGTYYVDVSMSGYYSQLFDHVDCATDCITELARGTRVTIAPGTTPNLTFDLTPTAAVTGQVSDAISGAALTGVVVQLWPSDGLLFIPAVTTDGHGNYRIAGAPPGDYYVVARSVDHQDMAYPEAPCSDFNPDISGCALAGAGTVTIALGESDVTGIDFALPPNASLSGTTRFRVHDGPGGVATNIDVGLYDATGNPITQAYSQFDGTYSLMDIPAGTYYLEAGESQYFSEIYAGLDCPLLGLACNPVSGTPLVLGQGQNMQAVDFDLVAGALVVGRVTDASTGEAVASVAIDTWNSTDDTHCGVAATDANGYYIVGDTTNFCAGSARKVSTDASTYVNQVFEGIECPLGPAYLGLCSLDGATPLALPATSPQPVEADFVLEHDDPIFASGFD